MISANGLKGQSSKVELELADPAFLRQITYKALKAARIGREILLHYHGNLKKVEHKHQAGLVSEADRSSEDAIKRYLAQEFPDFDFLGEESAFGREQAFEPSEKPRWILDPLDGTTNYVHGFPAFAVSLALEHRGRILVGVVDAPKLGEVYVAWRGGGAFCNGHRMQVSACMDIKDALLATGFISEVPENLPEQLKIFSRLVYQARGIRRAGAAALDLAWVARGTFDGYWEKNLKPWDVAAGLLLVQESGGRVCTYQGLEAGPFEASYVAANPRISEILVAGMRPDLLSETN